MYGEAIYDRQNEIVVVRIGRGKGLSYWRGKKFWL